MSDSDSNLFTTTREREALKRIGLYITHKCEHCHKPLNQSFYYCIRAGDDRRWCSRECQNAGMSWNEAPMPATVFPMATCARPGCGQQFEMRRADARYCSVRCRMIVMRQARRGGHKRRRTVTDKPHESR
jgi:hypothetical protein